MPLSPKEKEENAKTFTDKPGGAADAQFFERLNDRETIRASGPLNMTSEQINNLVDIMHAEKYPDGCRPTWFMMCESCALRLGGGPRR